MSVDATIPGHGQLSLGPATPGNEQRRPEVEERMQKAAQPLRQEAAQTAHLRCVDEERSDVMTRPARPDHLAEGDVPPPSAQLLRGMFTKEYI